MGANFLELSQNSNGQVFGPLASLINRHGLIAGATGTGKTVTLQKMAELFSDQGIAVFMADVKGDLSGLAAPGGGNQKVADRLKLLNRGDLSPRAYPVVFWDLNAELGHPIRTTPTEFGPGLLARVLNLNDTQSSVLQILFKIADDGGLLLLDLKDLLALLNFAQENLAQLKGQYGHLAPATVGSIQRALLAFEHEGGKFFGEPAISIEDFLQNADDGRGKINILAAQKIMQQPKVYSSFLIWMLSELFEQLPEVGDQEKPKIAFFFDEAHLLFKDSPKALVEKIEQMVRLIRSKGVGVYFVTQNPLDLPESVLGQLGNRVQHALRAFTPIDQKAVKIAASTMRPNPNYSPEKIITELGVGEALISCLDSTGSPMPVERVFILPPQSRLGPIADDMRKQVVSSSAMSQYYDKVIDRESAAEVLQKRMVQPAQKVESFSPTPTDSTNTNSMIKELLFGSTGPRGGRRDGLVQKAASSAARNIAGSIGRELVRGLLGGITGTSRRRR